tara:strand:+ start:4747 stop:4998 length:252 start_codon:yes stop_codon:yes gene_type:complete
VIRDPVAQIKPTEPAVFQVQMQLLPQTTIRSDAEAVSDQQHADQKFGIDPKATRLAVEIRQVAADATQIDKPTNGPKRVILGE